MGFHFYYPFSASSFTTTEGQLAEDKSVSQNNSLSVFQRKRIPSSSNACGADAKNGEILRRSIRSWKAKGTLREGLERDLSRLLIKWEEEEEEEGQQQQQQQ